MKKISWLIVALFIFANFAITPKANSKDSDFPTIPLEKKSLEGKREKKYKEGEVIVQYKSKNKKEKALDEIKNKTDKKDLSLEIEDEIDDLNMVLIKSKSKSTQELIKEFEDDEAVLIAESNYKKERAFVPNDTLFSTQWFHENTGQNVNSVSGTVDADVDSTEAWDIESAVATDTIVAIIDDGVEYNYADLASNMWDGTSCVDDLGNTISGGCPNHGWDYEDLDNDPFGLTHGTFIASIMAGENNNSSAFSGISRYNNVKLMALKFDFYVFSEIQAINFAINNGAKVINASFSGTDYSAAEKAAIESFDGIYVAAAGNETANNETVPSYPCNYNSSNIICVASSNQYDSLSSFSNYGTTSVDIAAPGENMIGRYDSSYYIGNGTSFAAPVVAGAAALLYAHRPGASTATIRSTILQSSDHKTTGLDTVACKRRLNIKTALQSIIDNTIPAEVCTVETSKTEVYRFYNPKSDAHLYTINSGEKDWIIATLSHAWKYEGIGFYAYENSELNTSPVYRFYNPKSDAHFYTISEDEKNWVIATLPHAWRYEGISFYAYKNSQANTIPLYRFYNFLHDVHFFTNSSSEKDWVIATLPHAWRYEGIGFYLPE